MKSLQWPVLLLAGAFLVSSAEAGDRFPLFHWSSNSNPTPAAPTPETTIPSAARSDTAASPPAPVIELAPATGNRPAHELPARLGSGSRPSEERVSWTAQPTQDKVRRVKSRHLVFNYKVQNTGPSGVMGAELWYTRDGQNWQKSPSGIQPQGTYQVDVSEDGLYGFILLARTGMGGGKEPPKTGDPAQFWVEVDSVKPAVVITGVKLLTGGRNVLISWKATDKNLAPQSINIYYLDVTTGQSIPIATHVDNSESYTWQVPASIQNQVRIRVEAADQAGNVGSDETTNPVQLDLSQPEVVDISVNAVD
jgi:hypothetical protein